MQYTFRKLLAVGLAVTMLVTCMATGLIAIALGTTNLLANFTLSDTTGVTMDTANNGFTISGGTGTAYFNDLVLEKTSTYELSFTLTLHGTTAQCPSIVLRDDGTGTGQFFNWTGFWADQGRFNTSLDPNGFKALVPTGMTATETAYEFKFELEPERVRLWVDGEAKVYTAGSTDAEGWVTLPAVKDGKIGFSSVNGGPNVTLSNLSLIKTVQGASTSPADVEAAIAAIGEVDAYSREAIDAARALYNDLSADDQAEVSNLAVLTAAEAAFASMNMLTSISMGGATNVVVNPDNSVKVTCVDTPAYFDGITLEKDATYIYEFDITYDAAPGSTFPWLILRDGGQYINAGAYGCIRVCDNLNFNDFEGNSGLTGSAGVPLRFRIIMKPDQVKVTVNGEVVANGPNVGVTITDGFIPLPEVENGKLGVTGGNPNVTYTLSNITLVKEGTAVADPLLLSAIAAINAIGTVDAYSRPAIEAARAAYDALPEEKQGDVPNAAVLTVAEAAFAEMNLLKDLSVSNTNAAVVDAATNSVKLTAGNTVYFNDLTLNKNSTYVYEFDMTFDGAVNATFPWLVLREGGQYLNVGAYGCMRLCNGLNFDQFLTNVGLTFGANEPQTFRIIMKPDRVKVLMNGAPVAFGANTGVVIDEDGFVVMDSVKNGKIGVTGGGSGTYTLSEISLTEIPGEPEDDSEAEIMAVEEAIRAIGTVDAMKGMAIRAARAAYAALEPELQEQVSNYATLTAAESAYAALNLLADMPFTEDAAVTVDGTTLTIDGSKTEEGGKFYADGLSLHQKATYIYEFDLKFNSTLAENSVTVTLRDDGEGNGQFLGFWGNINQLRICKTSDTNAFEDIHNPFGFEANKVYSFHIEMEENRVRLFVDGELRKGALCTDGDGWTTLPAVANGLLGFEYTTGANITLSNLWLGVANKADVDAAAAVDTLISAIGTVTLDSGNAIEAAESAYEVLTAIQKQFVTQYTVLTDARALYDLLVAQDQASPEDKAAAKAVMDKIAAIGTVTVNSKAAIEEAEAAYAALNDLQQTMVTNYADLTAARITYDNAVAAARVDGLIDAIGTVTANSASAIETARAAYDALTDEQKAMVTGYGTLERAEKAFAALDGTKDIYYYYPTTDDLMGANYWPNNVQQSDLATGGIHYRWDGAGTDWRTGLNIPLKLDGLHLTLANISFAGDRKQFAIYVADKDAQEGYTGSGKAPLIFIFDAGEGELRVTSQSSLTAGEAIIRSDALLAENLVGKQVELKITAGANGTYTVNLLGQTGTITKAMMDAALALTNPDKVYLTLCPWDWEAAAKVQFDLLAVHGGESLCTDTLSEEQLAAIDEVVTMIASIGEVTVEDKEIIEAARAAYDVLGDVEKSFVVNYADLQNAEWKLTTLDGSEAISYKDKDYYRPHSNETMGTNYWTSNLEITEANGGGIHFSWNMTGTDWRMGIDKPLKLDGLHLVFGNLKYSSANKRFAVYLSDLRDTEWAEQYSSYADPVPLVLVFDGNNGVVKVCSELVTDPDGTVLIQSPALLAENMEGREFDLKITANGDGTYTLSVMGLTATLTADIMEAAKGLTEYDDVYVTLCPWDWTTSTVMELDLLAMHGGKELCADDINDEVLGKINGTMEAIKAIFNEKGQVTMASKAKLEEARALYDALDDFLKGVVANYQDLVDAEEVFELVKAIDAIGTVAAEDAEVLKELQATYKALEPYKRKMVGNYLTLQQAQLDAYLLIRGDKDSATVPDSGTEGSGSPATGSTMLAVMLALAVAVTAAGVMFVCRRKQSAGR